jgi:two-component system, chemotaxis family, chemotaxis protein CheY
MSLVNYKFLIADDHFLLRQILSNTLKEVGATKIDWAIDGQDAITKIKEACDQGVPYDIVCLDWGMPKMNGLDVLKLCRQDNRFDDMAIVMVTAESEETNILNAIEEGATSYITKPFKADLLAKKLDELVLWLEKKRAKTVSA